MKIMSESTSTSTTSTCNIKDIPIIDLSLDNESTIIKELMYAFTTIGFATLINHNISEEIQYQAFDASKQFFQLSDSIKSKYKYVDQASNRGYTAFGAVHFDDDDDDDHNHDGEDGTVQKGKESDSKETLSIGWDDDPEYTNMWPTELQTHEFKTPLLQYFHQMETLHLQLMQYIGIGLKLKDPNQLVNCSNGHHENLMLLYYPETKIDPNNNRDITRGRTHTDFGTLTLLMQDSVGGLKVQRTDGTWINVQPMKNAIIVNVGDMLMRWTNDRLKATPHKVEAPSFKTNENGTAYATTTTTTIIPERYSIAFFCNANKDVEIKCLVDEKPKYSPINAHQYITQRLTDTINTY